MLKLCLAAALIFVGWYLIIYYDEPTNKEE